MGAGVGALVGANVGGTGVGSAGVGGTGVGGAAVGGTGAPATQVQVAVHVPGTPAKGTKEPMGRFPLRHFRPQCFGVAVSMENVSPGESSSKTTSKTVSSSILFVAPWNLLELMGLSTASDPEPSAAKPFTRTSFTSFPEGTLIT